jgi:hypothetical protein
MPIILLIFCYGVVLSVVCEFHIVFVTSSIDQNRVRVTLDLFT